MKIVYEIKLNEHIELFAMAHALRIAKGNAEFALRKAEEKQDETAIIFAKSVEMLSDTILFQFWERAHDMAGKKYIDNKATLNMKDGVVEFYDEKCDDCSEPEDDCEKADSEPETFEKWLENSGIQTSSDWGKA